MKIGIAGTRSGMTKQQRDNFRLFLLLNGKSITQLHHGSCKGVDVEVHELAASVPKRIVWPSTNERTRVDLLHEDGVLILGESSPLVRNESIISNTEKLIAFPKLQHEVLRSGTWHCIRYARIKQRPILIFWPDGSYTVEGDF